MRALVYCAFQNIQDMDEHRTVKLGETYRSFAEVERKVIPIISKCLEGMVTAAKNVDERKVCRWKFPLQITRPKRHSEPDIISDALEEFFWKLCLKIFVYSTAANRLKNILRTVIFQIFTRSPAVVFRYILVCQLWHFVFVCLSCWRIFLVLDHFLKKWSRYDKHGQKQSSE